MIDCVQEGGSNKISICMNAVFFVTGCGPNTAGLTLLKSSQNLILSQNWKGKVRKGDFEKSSKSTSFWLQTSNFP